MTAVVAKADVAKVRAFNRRYTQAFGFFRDRLDDSAFALTEARVLYEIAHGEKLTAADIGRFLDIDKAQLSRIIAKLRKAKLVAAAPSPDHAKHLLLSLTAKGAEAFRTLNAATESTISAHLAQIAGPDRARLIQAMDEINAALEGKAAATNAYRLRDPVPGDLGWIIHRQACLYTQEYGWDWTYEALVARILGGFVEHFDPAREKAWVAEIDGRIAGSIFLMQSDEPDCGKLRLLYVEPWARGQGLGAALVAACIEQAKKSGYRRLELWTNSVLTSARHIYQAAGFTLIEEKQHRSFGADLTGQVWRLELPKS